jgi:hypothetical protein
VADELRALLATRRDEVAEEGTEPPGVVEVAVGEDDIVGVAGRDPHRQGVPEKDVRVAEVEEHLGLLVPDVDREPGLTEIIVVSEDRVVAEEGDVHADDGGLREKEVMKDGVKTGNRPHNLRALRLSVSLPLSSQSGAPGRETGRPSDRR